MTLSDTESDISDTEREGIDAKDMLKQKVLNHKCKQCNCVKSTIQQRFPTGVSNNISSYVICDDCLKVIKMIDNMNNRDMDIDIRDVKGLNENFEIWLFFKINKFPDKKEFWLIDNYKMDFMEKYYNLAKQVYNIAYDEEALMYEGMNVNHAILHDDSIDKSEIYHTLCKAIRWIGWFQMKNDIYNENTSYKIIDRLNEYFFTELEA